MSARSLRRPVEEQYHPEPLQHLRLNPEKTAVPMKKRRRLRACDSCRIRKIRCDAQPGSCRNCRLYGTKCVIIRDGTFLPRASGLNRASAEDRQLPRDASPISEESHDLIHPPLHPPTDASSRSSVHESGRRIRQAPVSEPYHGSPTTTSITTTSPSTRRSDQLEGVVTTETGHSPKNSKFANMSSAQVLAKSAEELFKQQAPDINVMAFFSSMMSFAEEYQPLILPQLSPLIDKEIADGHVSRYFSTYHILFPILDIQDFHQSYSNFWANADVLDVADKAIIFLVIALGSFEDMPDVYNSHFQAVYSIYSQLIGRPYMSSVQCFIMMTLCFMNVGKDGQAILTSGLAVRIAQSLGLHRSLSTHHHPHEFNFVLKEHNLRNCIWWTCHCLDKYAYRHEPFLVHYFADCCRKLCFESGRPSAVCDEQCNADLPTTDHSGGASQTGPFIFLLSFIEICKVLACISLTLFNIDSSSLDETTLISRMSAADGALLEWSETLPRELLPEQDSLGRVGDGIVGIGASLLHCMYYNALVVIHRAGLVGGISDTMKAHPNPRVATSDNTCLTAARKLAQRVNDLFAEKRLNPIPRWITPYPFNAVAAIFVGSMKTPGKWSCAIDIALMRTMQDLFPLGGTGLVAQRFHMLVDSFCDAFDIAKSAHRTDPHLTISCDYELEHHNTASSNWSADGYERSTSKAWNEMGATDSLLLGVPADGQMNDQVQFGNMFGDNPSLWNLQLWPVDPWETRLQLEEY